MFQLNGDDPEPRDAWTVVDMEGHFHILPRHEGTFDLLDPIQLHNSSTVVKKSVARFFL